MISHDFLNSLINKPLEGTPQLFTQAQAHPLVDELSTALTFIQSAHESAKDSKLANFHPEAYADICDALHHCQSAIDYLGEITEDA